MQIGTTGPSISGYINKLETIFAQSGLNYKVHDTGTVIGRCMVAALKRGLTMMQRAIGRMSPMPLERPTLSYTIKVSSVFTPTSA